MRVVNSTTSRWERGVNYRGTDKVYISGPRKGRRDPTFNFKAKLDVLIKSIFDRPDPIEYGLPYDYGRSVF